MCMNQWLQVRRRLSLPICRFPIRKEFRFFANSASPTPLQRRRTDMASRDTIRIKANLL
jgi:hypothetical protein